MIGTEIPLTRFRRRKLKSLQSPTETVGYIAFALGLGFVVPQVNRWFFPDWTSPVDKATMSTILSAISSGMITLSGLVFSLIFVLVQFGSATYSPRITRIFARSLVLHHSLGIFTGTFLYALMALRTIGMESTTTVSGFTVWVGFLWLLASILVLARLVRVFGTLTITNVLVTLGEIGRKSIANAYRDYDFRAPAKTERKDRPENALGTPGTVTPIRYDGMPAYVRGYDIQTLVKLARTNGGRLVLPYSIGDAVKDGSAVAVVYGNGTALSSESIIAAIDLGPERIFQNDPKYAIRLLVDIAIRALSPAVNDPTTAVQALDHLESLLRRLGNAELDIGEVRDSSGVVRVKYKTPQWEDFLQLGLAEIMQYGADSIQVERRVEAVLLFLEQSVPPERAEVVARFRRQRHSLSQGSFKDPTFREWADIPDREGIGGGADGLKRLTGSDRTEAPTVGWMQGG